MNPLKEKYLNEVVPAMQKTLNLENPMQYPKIEKVVVNIGLGEALDNPKALDAAVGDLTQITGQKPIVTKARVSIANFKLREGRQIGAKVTLRGEKMWGLLDRVINIVLPRVRDFRGYEKVDKIRGMEITIVTTAQTDDQARVMLSLLGMPFRKD